ncbi:tRNA pseudouridine(38-40) synthase TruA [Cellulophaga sp. E16_2]|uniref:tRNA pseudouridine synthase A n=1 Tax=Cellulophaga algicola (strain DSM 14237 / IC166 / ACAM 630) TaxID=688270 RepID=E6XAY4_CELAD|nr:MULTISPECIES: tRNA pseudouridine(38-40) synthase TruA [Cellulophaga]ADV47825.1 tRNA pseudouridine synthase A [Cellulophaga algicola DSM 14237]MBO0590286.1 tRNA pseudouridine(38-40) synthase TruA [Cellulophaga sp. E16_2]
MRYFIRFSYFGKHYHGWQKQPNAVTVQGVLEDALSKLLANEIILMGAGRTDAGVHAKELYAHFDFEEIPNKENFVFRLNAFLPKDIAILDVFQVPEDAHARFNAVARTYEYWIVQQKNPFLTNHAHLIKYPLDINKMNEAAQVFLSHIDFECFSKSNTAVNTFNCDVKYAEWKVTDGILVFTITADRFLRNMVRAIVGTLLEVGLGKIDISNVKAILKSKDRSKAGASAPAKGLYLTSVLYPDNIVKNHG